MIRPQKEFSTLPVKGEQFLFEDTEDEYHVTFRITDFCNYKCEYCHWRFGDHYDYRDIIKTITLMDGIITNKHIRYYFHGGEPSLHPRVLDIIDFILESDRNIVEFQTNMSKPLQYWEDMFARYENKRFEFNVSYHHRFAKKNFTKFLQKLDTAYKANVLSKIDIMLEKDDVDQLKQNTKIILAKPYGDRTEMVYGFFESDDDGSYKDFHDKYNKFLAEYSVDGKIYNTSQLFKEGIDFRGWYCSVGKEYCIMNGNGDFFMCGAATVLPTGRKGKTRPYGNIITNSAKFKFITRQSFKCQWAPCGGEFYISKIKQ